MRFGILLDSEDGIYFAGDKITGEVTVSVDRPETLKKITVALRGVAKIAFREGSTAPFFLASNNLYYDHQTVISREVIVFVNANLSPIVEKGFYSYSFNFLLPNSMVTSFSSTHGYVTYSLEIVARKRFFTERLRRELKIFEFNENTPQLSYRPLSFEMIILPKVSCLFPILLSRQDAKARCHVHVPRISFYSGETVEVNVFLMDYQVGSQGKSAVITSELLQEFAFQGGLYNQRLVEPRRPIVSQKSRGVCANHHLLVPICARTGALYRRARVAYYLRVRVQMLCRQYQLLIPITVTGPLNDMSRKWTSHYAQSTQSSVSSDTDIVMPDNMNRRAENLLRLLVVKEEYCTSMEGLDIPEAVPEVDEEVDEVAMMVEIENTPDIFATCLPDLSSTHRDEARGGH